MQIPLDRLLLETDAPDGRPRLGEPYDRNLVDLEEEGDESKGQLNHPANIRCGFQNLCQSARSGMLLVKV